MDNTLSIKLKNFKMASEATIEELDINISFKCEPEVALKLTDMIGTIVSSLKV